MEERRDPARQQALVERGAGEGGARGSRVFLAEERDARGQQAVGEGGRELRVDLQGPGPLANEHPANRAVVAARPDSRVGRDLEHLVLMAGGEMDDLPRGCHPFAGLVHLVLLRTDAPPKVGLADRAAERLGEQLVAEADADERCLGAHDLAQQLLHGAQPSDVVVHAEPAGRAQPPILLVE